MSVQRLTVLNAKGLDPQAVMLREYPEWGIVCSRAALIRQFGKGVQPAITEEDGPGHAVIEDLTGGQQKQLARQSVWLVVPPAHSPPA